MLARRPRNRRLICASFLRRGSLVERARAPIPEMPSSSHAPSVLDTELGLSNDEIALLRAESVHAASLAGNSSSSRAASRASSQGRLLLNGSSLTALSRHFDALMRRITDQITHLSEQSAMAAQTQYDRAGNAIQMADSEIARLHKMIRQIDELDAELDRLARVREVVASYRARVLDMERELEGSGTTASHAGGAGKHRHHSSKHHGETSSKSSRHHHSTRTH